MDQLHIYVYEYSETQKNVHKIFITTPTEQIVLQHHLKNMHKNDESSSTKGTKVQLVRHTIESLKKYTLSNLFFRFNHLGDYTFSVRDLERYPTTP